MKNHQKSSTNKLVARFDNELKTLLLNDLNNIKGNKNQHSNSNHQARMRVRLSVA